MKDLIIVGGGPAALSAAVYAARRDLDIALVADELGGHPKETDKIENYLGFKSIKGFELAEKFEEHLKDYNIEIVEDKVKNVYREGDKVIHELEEGDKMGSKTSIIASGSKRKKLSVPGEKELRNKGLTYCAICDGPLFQNQNVAVIGGSNSGIKAARYLRKKEKKVYILEVLEKLNGESITIEEIKNKSNIEIITKAKTTRILGNKSVKGLKYKDLEEGSEKEIGVEGIAIEIGIEPNSQMVKVEKNERGQIKVDNEMRTSSNRIFAAGDVTDKGWEQIAVAVGQGCIAALEADKTISDQKV